MAILLNFIIPEGHLLEINPLPVVHRQSQNYDNLTRRVYICAEPKSPLYAHPHGHNPTLYAHAFYLHWGN